MKNLAQSFYDWYTQTLRHPKYRWVLVAGTLVYLLSPIDISPDFLPIIGWIDDGVVATLLVAELSQILMNVLSGRDRNSESSTKQEPNPTVIEIKAE
ncbi:MAG TPA: YkvA family protein [Trichocoleus sp.]